MNDTNFNREEIAPEVFFSCVTDPKFRHNCITVYIVAPLDEATSAQNALLPFLLRQSSAVCPDSTMLERRLCDLYGADLSADVSSNGEQQMLSVSICGIDDRYAIDGEPVSRGLAQLLCDIVLRPNVSGGGFDVQTFETERHNLSDLIASEINDKRGYAIKRCREIMCAGTPLAVSKYGRGEQVDLLTPQGEYRRYLELMRSARIELIFTGCGDPALARESFRSEFAAIEREPAAARVSGTMAAGALKERSEEMAVSQCKLVMGLAMGSAESGEDRYAARLMSIMLGGTPFSKLFVNVREKRSLCYYCAASAEVYTGIMVIDSGVDADKAEETRNAVMEQVAAMADGDFTDKELAETKLFYTDIITSVTDSIYRLENWYIGGILHNEVISPAESAARMNAVEAEAIKRAARQLRLDTVFLLKGNGAPEEDETEEDGE